MLRRIGLSCSRAAANASSPQGYQSTGLSACCSRYGLVSFFSRLAKALSSQAPCGCGEPAHGKAPAADFLRRAFSPGSRRVGSTGAPAGDGYVARIPVISIGTGISRRSSPPLVDAVSAATL